MHIETLIRDLRRLAADLKRPEPSTARVLDGIANALESRGVTTGDPGRVELARRVVKAEAERDELARSLRVTDHAFEMLRDERNELARDLADADAALATVRAERDELARLVAEADASRRELAAKARAAAESMELLGRMVREQLGAGTVSR